MSTYEVKTFDLHKAVAKFNRAYTQYVKTIEGNFNAHVYAFDRAFDNNKDCRMAFENGYLTAIEYVLNQLGVKYEIGDGGHITIEDEENYND